MKGPGPDSVVVDLYRVTVDLADRVSDRRGAANTLYLSLQTAILAVLGFLTAAERSPDARVLSALCGAGVLMAAVWWLQLRSYRDLNRAKFAVIQELEKRLPVAPFTDEWKLLKEDSVKRWRPRYAELGTVERFIPWIFAAVNAILAVYLGAS